MAYETFNDIMCEYDRLRDGAKRFSAWDQLDEFVKELAKRVAPPPVVERYKLSDFRPPVITPPEEPLRKFQQYSYDSEGTPIHHEPDNGN
jgi:hypothetical protein